MRQLRFRLDSTNKDTQFLRNKIRWELLPHLKRSYNPNIKEILAGLSTNCVTDYDFLDRYARKLMTKLGRRSHRNSIIFELKRLTSLHPGMQRMLLRLAIEKLKGNTNRLTHTHMKKIEELIQSENYQKTVHLPLSLSATKDKKYLSLHLRKT